MKIKSGYKTSEFWFTLVSFIFSGLYLTGILTENDQKEELITVVSHAVESVILIGGQAFILYKYIKGRTEVKKIVEQEKIVVEKENLNEPKRTNTRKSKQTPSGNKKLPSKSKKRSPK